MYKEDLLNRHDRIVYRIILDVYLQDGKANLVGISERLKIPLSTLKRYLSGLKRELAPWVKQNKIAFGVSGTQVTFQLFGVATIEEILVEKRLVTADNVVLLKFLYQHHLRYQDVQLMRLLHVSEASLYRKLRVLNQLLAPFDLMVGHGQLTGNLRQLQFFYFNFWRTIGTKMPVLKETAAIRQYLIDAGFMFDEQLTERLNTWLTVCQHSAQNQWHFRQKTSVQVQRLVAAMPVEIQIPSQVVANVDIDCETLAFFLMLHSEFVFSDGLWTKFLRKTSAPIKRLNRLIGVCQAGLNDGWPVTDSSPQLTTQKLAGLLIVPLLTKGDVQIFNDISFRYFNRVFFDASDDAAFMRVHQQMTQTASPWINRFMQAHWSYIERRLWPYLVTKSANSMPPVTVGLALGFSEQVTLFTKRQLKNELKKHFAVSVETYQPDLKVDLLVVNERTASSIVTPQKQAVERITELGTETDYQRIARRLQALKSGTHLGSSK